MPEMAAREIDKQSTDEAHMGRQHKTKTRCFFFAFLPLFLGYRCARLRAVYSYESSCRYPDHSIRVALRSVPVYIHAVPERHYNCPSSATFRRVHGMLRTRPGRSMYRVKLAAMCRYNHIELVKRDSEV